MTNPGRLHELTLQLMQLKERINDNDLSDSEKLKLTNELNNLEQEFNKEFNSEHKPVITNNARIQLLGLSFN